MFLMLHKIALELCFNANLFLVETILPGDDQTSKAISAVKR